MAEWLDRPERALHVMEAISRKDAERLLRVARAAEQVEAAHKHNPSGIGIQIRELRAALADEDQP